MVLPQDAEVAFSLAQVANVRYNQSLPLAAHLPGLVFKPSLSFAVVLGVGDEGGMKVINLQAMKQEHVEAWVLGLQAAALAAQASLGTEALFRSCSEPLTYGGYLWKRTRAKLKELAVAKRVKVGQLLLKAVNGVPVVKTNAIL